MADRELPLHDLLGFMEDDERARWDSGTEETRATLRKELTALWYSIPDPADDDSKPPYTHPTNWAARDHNPDVRQAARREWKKARKAKAREEQAKQPKPRDERAASSTRSELDTFWKPIDAINEPTKPTDELRKQLEAFRSLVGPPPEPETPKPQLGALLDSLKKSAGAQSEPPPKSGVPEQPKPLRKTLQDVADEFTVHVGSQLEDAQGTVANSPTEFMYKRPPGFVPHSQKPETLADEPTATLGEIRPERSQQKDKGSGSISAWLFGNASTKGPTHEKPTLEGLQRFEDERKAEQKKRRRRPGKPPTPPTPEQKLLRGLETKEIVALVVTFLALVLVFFVAAPSAAGVVDMTLARILLGCGWAGAVIAAFVIEWLSSRSLKRIIVTTLLTALVVGVFALSTNYWIGTKKAEQERARLPQPTPTPSVASSPKLHDYFTETNRFAVETIDQRLTVKDESVKVEARINMDYSARARFLTFYVPDTARTFEICSLIINRANATNAEFDREFHDEYGPAEGRKTEMKDLKFTGQIIVYHERLLLQSEIDSLSAKAAKTGLSVTFRGTYYVMAQIK